MGKGKKQQTASGGSQGRQGGGSASDAQDLVGNAGMQDVGGNPGKWMGLEAHLIA
ncbi:MAG: hypothetical protein JRI25_07685, partial [Deltaproteobacteria bacterium]|nr:hypothetical protein [Deltaproteobacteria bacterium]